MSIYCFSILLNSGSFNTITSIKSLNPNNMMHIKIMNTYLYTLNPPLCHLIKK